ncbi:hypothetical protein IF1G_04821 [Cordyceps javanica]|uniref:Uncharacterized protein n=1 Tax=Cordyceps javanica TaxID=43265 RepID=A0A545V3E6_9HYPO|nr:hypothetical protein IF1G_04821 [Cordyceps javanica]
MMGVWRRCSICTKTPSRPSTKYIVNLSVLLFRMLPLCVSLPVVSLLQKTRRTKAKRRPPEAGENEQVLKVVSSTDRLLSNSVVERKKSQRARAALTWMSLGVLLQFLSRFFFLASAILMILIYLQHLDRE